MRMVNESILVTGGTRGIGRAIVDRFADLGATVHFCGRDAGTVSDVARSVPGSHGHVADLASPTDRARLAREVTDAGPVTVLVNNAGVGQIIDLTAGDVIDPTFELDINVVAPIDLTMRLLPAMRSVERAAVVNIGSALAYVPMAAEPVYCATKAALHSWSQSLRAQLADTNVRVIEALLPTVDTAMATHFDAKKVLPSRVADEIVDALAGRSDEIRFGQATALYVMSRVAPGLIFGKLNQIGIRHAEAAPALN